MDAQLPVGGAALVVGSAGVVFAGRELVGARRTIQAAQAHLSDLGRSTVHSLEATFVGAVGALDSNLQSMRGSTGRMVDHMLTADYAGPRKILDYVRTTRSHGTVAKAAMDRGIDEGRAVLIDAAATMRSTTLEAYESGRSVVHATTKAVTGPRMQLALGAGAVGGLLVLVGANQLVDALVDR